ncbi:hypothetical protein [Luteimonas sp. MC1750]|uniref:hypothetical protein n=1 Tax=Luteimonas sp. MC1750 TaxID=2799326 RepID=UPI0018F071BA|nr:hypothetical protein [Luteimonas sp. MC1750]MBJ6984064.1 hypothetical protein [Luteimonas sp. MC1750]QQO06874.1 hypothetical protein JGR68_05470 [Luteimonas sp. MC1750]
MSTRDTVLAVLRQSIDAINAQLPAARRLGTSPDQALVGAGSGVESLTLMGLVVDIEDRLMDAFDLELPLADMLGLPLEHNPFRSLDALASELAGRVEAR